MTAQTPDAPGQTPGPWYVVRYGDGDSLVICRDEAGDKRVAFMATPGCRDQQERRKVWKRIKADARLIAAAPELLQLVRDALGIVNDQMPGEFPAFEADARAALTKAGPQ